MINNHQPQNNNTLPQYHYYNNTWSTEELHSTDHHALKNGNILVCRAAYFCCLHQAKRATSKMTSSIKKTRNMGSIMEIACSLVRLAAAAEKEGLSGFVRIMGPHLNWDWRAKRQRRWERGRRKEQDCNKRPFRTPNKPKEWLQQQQFLKG